MKHQLRIFFTALMFYTRIPCPKWVDHDAAYLNLATLYFPVIGWIVGAIVAAMFYVASLVFGPVIGVIFSIGSGVLLTGAFHEDGFADVCDGFGGGWTKERILSIMKDSRVGTYGVVGLVLLLGLKLLALVQLAENLGLWSFLVFYLSAHTLSRWVAATTIFTHEYVRENEDSKAKPVAKRMTRLQLFGMTFVGLLPLALGAYWLGSFWWFALIPGVYLLKVFLLRFFKKWIGGYTGDCLGAIQQVSEVLIYLGGIVLWKFT